MGYMPLHRKILGGQSKLAKGVLLGRPEGLSAFTSEELEILKKFHNQNPRIREPELTRAFTLTNNNA